MIGLRERPSEAAVRAFDPNGRSRAGVCTRSATACRSRARPKERPAGTGRGCRAVVAAAMSRARAASGRVFRALQLANFTTALYLDDAESIREALRVRSRGRRRPHRRSHRRSECRRRVRAPARRGALGCGHACRGAGQDGDLGRRRAVHGALDRVSNGRVDRVAGGWQPLLGYDTLLANFAPELERFPPPDSPEPLLDHFAYGLTTAEVALLLAHGSDPMPDRGATEAMLMELVEHGRAVRVPVGSDALWVRP